MNAPIKRPWLVGYVQGGAFYSFLAEPMECPVCRSMRCAVVNRHGRTRCVDCDAKEFELVVTVRDTAGAIPPLMRATHVTRRGSGS